MTTTSEILELMKAMQLIAATKEAYRNGNMLDVVQPNGKKLRDCTGTEVREIAEWMGKVGEVIDSLDRRGLLAAEADA